MKFSNWLENRLLSEGSKKRGSVSNNPPKPESNVVKPERESKQRQASGRRNTKMDTTPKRLRTRGDRNRSEIEQQ